MQIKDLAQSTGVNIETIRYYERKGLLPAPPRRENGYRKYDENHLERLAFIRHCRSLDMPLENISHLLLCLKKPVEYGVNVDDLINEQLDRVRAQLRSMKSLEKQLLHLQSRCNGKHKVEGCGVLNNLIAAAQGKACACHPEKETSSTVLTEKGC